MTRRLKAIPRDAAPMARRVFLRARIANRAAAFHAA